MDNDFDLMTLSVKTINNGMHYYFKLNSEQQNALKKFNSSTALCFTTSSQQRNIDIKYNNQVFFGPSHIEFDDDVLKYKICDNVDIVELPTYLFDEILRTYNNQNEMDSMKSRKLIEKVKSVKNDEKNKINEKDDESDESVEKIKKLSGYLDCLNVKRFVSRDDWLIVGAIIFNECGSFELFNKYSKKAENYDENGCIKLWNSFKANRNKKVP
jgi:hypothetical protein